MKLEVLDRGFHTLDIVMHDGISKQFKIPSELTVGEIERLLEVQAKMEKLADEQVSDTGSAQLRLYWGYIFTQLEIIFKHYQPEITQEYLRDNILPTDAIRILAFFADNRFIEKESEDSLAKKKTRKIDSRSELIELRRAIVFLVKQGFGLFDLKRLYIDEFKEYYNETVQNLEASGELPEGSYDRLKGVDRTSENLALLFKKAKTN